MRRRGALGLIAIAALAGCASTSDAPTAIRSESAPAGPPPTEQVTTTVPRTTLVATTEADTSDVDTTDVDTTETDTTDVATSLPITLPPVTLPPVTIPGTLPTTTIDPGAYDAAVAAWSTACATAHAGIDALPADVAASLGELAKVISDLDAAMTTIPPTGREDDPSLPVRDLITSAGASLTSAAVAFAGGNMAEVERLRDEAVATMRSVRDVVVAFGATC